MSNIDTRRDWRDPRHYQAPRTLDSAFRGARYADPIEPPEISPAERVAGVLLALVISVLSAAALVHFWSCEGLC